MGNDDADGDRRRLKVGEHDPQPSLLHQRTRLVRKKPSVAESAHAGIDRDIALIRRERSVRPDVDSAAALSEGPFLAPAESREADARPGGEIRRAPRDACSAEQPRTGAHDAAHLAHRDGDQR